MKKAEIRTSAYYDSVILMQLQRSLSTLPNVNEAGVVMGTVANKDVLAQSNLLTPEIQAARPDDLIIVIDATTEEAATDALAQVDTLLQRKGNRDPGSAGDYRPKSLESATQMLPAAGWTMISTPGRYAADVANDALTAGKHVFLYSDNVSLEDELKLKQRAAEKGLLVMGPDCGTAIINGVGLGFANRVRRGPIGIVGASGTGLQQVSARIHERGGGITHAIGTGGRDLSADIGAITARQALDLFARDEETKVIVLISKPPALEVAAQLLNAASKVGKPVVINFIGYEHDTEPDDTEPDDTEKNEALENLHFAQTLESTAETALTLAGYHLPPPRRPAEYSVDPFAAAFNMVAIPKPTQHYLRGLFSGGTLAYEMMHMLRDELPEIYSNVPLDKQHKLENAAVSQEHTIIDLGEDDFTVGRLHPMMDNDLRIKRLAQEAADPETALILLDVVLGDGAHPDPASELAPAIADAYDAARADDRLIEFYVIVVGTEDDPQQMNEQIRQLNRANARCVKSNDDALFKVLETMQRLASRAQYGQEEATPPESMAAPQADPAANPLATLGAQIVGNSFQNELPQVDLSPFREPVAAINIGIETFTKSLMDQGAEVVDVEWKPPAGGNEKLAGLLAKMKKK